MALMHLSDQQPAFTYYNENYFILHVLKFHFILYRSWQYINIFSCVCESECENNEISGIYGAA